MNTPREGARRGSLGLRAGVGAVIALGSTVAARARESWETGGPGISALALDDVIVAVFAGLVAGVAFHLARGREAAGVMRHYLAWMLAATVAAVPVLLPDARGDGPWILLVGAPAFGILAGGGWAIFLRRIEGHDL